MPELTGNGAFHGEIDIEYGLLCEVDSKIGVVCVKIDLGMPEGPFMTGL